MFECVSDYDTTYKIGYTRNKDFKKRISALQTGNKDKIKCIDYFMSFHGCKIETALHNLYSYKNEGGEWFYLELNDIINFKNVCQKLEDNFTTLKEYNNPFL